ncbi:MAG: alanyl-tRNA editing protein [Acidobacteriia bacterium]|jgi:alanyl-tRNA synthetase|nr:alanyl-tRNA editing protein [Terriglobia bacterium]
MTERLYYHDAFLREFAAHVMSCAPMPGEPERWQVVLDCTAFYPTSGGQPHDTGRLADARVLDVYETEDGTVVHVTDRALAPGPVHGAIDWPRRWDHMQQHTGQHLLSAVFVEHFGLPTVSFHLGRNASTIDLEARAVLPQQLAEAEQYANAIVTEDRPVEIRWARAEELAELDVRRPVARTGLLRIVEIEGCDRQPCGGTHVARTGQIGCILLRRCEKVRGHWRVEFLCGQRAVTAARADFEALGEVARRLSCNPAEVPTLVTRALEERQALYRERQRLQEHLAELEALSLLATRAETRSDGIRQLVHVFEHLEPGYLRLLVNKMIAEDRVRVLVGTRLGGHVIFAQSRGLQGDMNVLLQQALAAAGGRGGGTPQFAQGLVPEAARLEAFLETARNLLG